MIVQVCDLNYTMRKRYNSLYISNQSVNRELNISFMKLTIHVETNCVN